MADSMNSMAGKWALPQGSLVQVGETYAGETAIEAIRYSPDSFEETKGDALPGPDDPQDSSRILWLRVRGLTDLDKIQAVGDKFDLHPLVLEDVVNTEHRPKLEEFEDYLFLMGRRLEMDAEGEEIVHKQVSLVLGRNWVVSFGMDPKARSFSPMVERLRQGRGRARRLGPDYLFLALLDILVDSYFEVVELLEDRLDELEETVMSDSDESVLTEIYHLKNMVQELRRTVWPMRETANSLIRDEFALISDQALPFARDIYDHATHVLEATEALRDNLSSLMDLCLSQAGHRMNQVMKVLTVIATIFIPLTFLAGVYGMNFKFMPELDLPWAYPALLGVMVLVVLAMLLFFKRKKWL